MHGFFAKLYTLIGIQQLRLNRITNKIAKHTYVANLNRCRGSSNALNKTLLVFKWLGLNFVSEPSEIKFTSIIQRPYLPVNRVGGTNSRGPVEARKPDSSDIQAKLTAAVSVPHGGTLWSIKKLMKFRVDRKLMKTVHKA